MDIHDHVLMSVDCARVYATRVIDIVDQPHYVYYLLVVVFCYAFLPV